MGSWDMERELISQFQRVLRKSEEGRSGVKTSNGRELEHQIPMNRFVISLSVISEYLVVEATLPF